MCPSESPLPPPTSYPFFSPQSDEELQCDDCHQKSTQYDMHLLPMGFSVLVRWARFAKNKATNVRDIREGNQCWGCNCTNKYEFNSMDPEELRTARGNSADLEVIYMDKRRDNVLNDYHKSAGTTGVAFKQNVRHSKVDIQRFVKKTDEDFVEKFKEGTWYSLNELCTLKSHDAKTVADQRLFAASLSLKVEIDNGEEGVIILDNALGSRVKVGTRSGASKEKVHSNLNATEAKEMQKKLRQDLKPQSDSLMTMAQVDALQAGLSAQPIESSSSSQSGYLVCTFFILYRRLGGAAIWEIV